MYLNKYFLCYVIMSSKKSIEISPTQYKEYMKLKTAHDKYLVAIKVHNKKNLSKTFHCDICDQDYKLLSKSNHLKSKIHNKKASRNSSDTDTDDDIDAVKTAPQHRWGDDFEEYLRFKQAKIKAKKIKAKNVTTKSRKVVESKSESSSDDEMIQKKTKKATKIIETVNKLDSAINKMSVGNPYLDLFNKTKK